EESFEETGYERRKAKIAAATSASASRPSIHGERVGTTAAEGLMVGVFVGVFVATPVVGVLVGVLVGVFVGVFVSWPVGVLVGVLVGVFVGPGAPATKEAENSDVSAGRSEPTVSSVAVAVTTVCPPGIANETGPKLPFGVPVPAQVPVVRVVKPRKVCPSPFPEGSQEALEKNSIWKVLFEMLFRVPEIVTLPTAIEAEVMTGKFCRSLGPVSASQSSFGVTPSPARSMPRPPFEKIEFPRIGLVVESPRTKMPPPTLG